MSCDLFIFLKNQLISAVGSKQTADGYGSSKKKASTPPTKHGMHSLPGH